MSVDYIYSDNQLLGQNIVVHCYPFGDVDFIDRSEKCPQQIYMRSNYPKMLLNSDYNQDVTYKIYNQSQGDIVFMIYPIAEQDINAMREYTCLTNQQIKNYPSLTFSPSGNMISTPVIPDRLYHQNYLIDQTDNSKSGMLTKSNLSDIKKNFIKKSLTDTSIQYELQPIIWGVNSNLNSLPINARNFGKVGSYTFKVDKGIKKFEFINVNTSELLKNQSSSNQGSSTSSTVTEIKKVYKLHKDIMVENPQNAGQDKLNPGYPHEAGDSYALTNGLSFIFGINFQKGAVGNAIFRFGDYTINMNTNKQVSISIKDVEKTSTLQIQNQNSLQPSFCSGSTTDWLSFIAYPVWDGIALQSGVVKTSPVKGNFKHGEKTQYPSGIIAEHNLPNTKESQETVNKQQFLCPSYQEWLTGGDEDDVTNESKAQEGHIYVKPANANWLNNTENDYTLQLINTNANFYYIPLYFLPNSKFKLCFRGIQDKKANIGATVTKQYGGKNNRVIYENTYTANLIYSHPDVSEGYLICAGGESDKEEDIPAKKIGTIQETDLYQVLFDLSNPCVGEGFPRKPLQIHGVLITHERKTQSSPIQTSNGVFNLRTIQWTDAGTNNEAQKDDSHIYFQNSFRGDDCGSGYQWIHYASNINIQHNDASGSSGNIVLDKYAFMGQKNIPSQAIGGVRLSLHGGREDFITENSGYKGREYIFSGLAMQTNFMDSFNQDTLTINLKGMHHKLQDIKMINAPFWDGDDLKSIMQWMQNYTGVKMNFDYAASSKKNRRIAVSSNFSKPALDVQGGTPALQAINTACQMANHRFVVQTDGVGYIYLLSKDYSLPAVYKHAGQSVSSNKKTQKTYIINEKNIISLDVQPIFANVYNIVISAALKGTNNGNTLQAANSQSQIDGIQLNTKVTYQYDKTVPQIPWSRMFAHKHDGFMSLKELQKRHEIDCSANKRYSLHANVTLLGKADLWIYDTLEIFQVDFLVSDFSHSIDFNSKQFITTVQADYFPWKN